MKTAPDQTDRRVIAFADGTAICDDGSAFVAKHDPVKGFAWLELPPIPGTPAAAVAAAVRELTPPTGPHNPRRPRR